MLSIMALSLKGQILRCRGLAIDSRRFGQLAELDIRTIQRIEKEEVKPYFSTLKILSNVLYFDFISAANNKP